MSLNNLIGQKPLQMICDNLSGRDRRVLALLNKDFFTEVVKLEENKKKVEAAVTILIDIEPDTITNYRLVIRADENILEIAQGDDIRWVISHLNKFTVETIKLSFLCSLDERHSQKFTKWMPTLMGILLGGIKTTTFLGGILTIPITIDFANCSSHIDRQFGKLLPLLIGYGARDIILRNLELDDLKTIPLYNGKKLTIECRDKNPRMNSKAHINVKKFIYAQLHHDDFDEIFLIVGVNEFDKNLGAFIMGYLNDQTGMPIECDEKRGNIILPGKKVTYEYDAKIRQITFAIIPNEESEEETRRDLSDDMDE